MAVLKGSEEGRIAFLVSYLIVKFDSLDEITNNVNVATSTGEMKRHLSFGLSGRVQQYLQ
jgi:hypothetical protein